MSYTSLPHFLNDLDSESPILKKCDESEIQRFIAGLKFENGGLAHAEYGMIEGRLSEDEFFEVWAGFGIDRETFTLYKDKYCKNVGKGCKFKESSLCNTQFCGRSSE